MRKIIKIITAIIIVLIILSLNNYNTKLDEKAIEGLDKCKIIDIQIIDKLGKMQELYEDPRKEEYVQVDIIIDGKYYADIGIRTKGDRVYDF